MAVINWQKPEQRLNPQTQSRYDAGFDLREIFRPFAYIEDASQYSFKAFTAATTYFNMAIDKYVGIFYGYTDEITGGFATSLTRTGQGTISDISIDYKDIASAAATASKTDDMAVWEKALSGNDTITGTKVNDRLESFAGDDKLTGGGGADVLTGGKGADTFIFKTTKDSTVAASGRDTIYDFVRSQKDKIDVSGIDAKSNVAGNQAFKFIGAQPFHNAPGELRVEKIKGGAYVHGDVNGDGRADFSIFLKSISALTKADFIL